MVARGWREGREGSDCWRAQGLLWRRWSILKLERGDAYTTLWCTKCPWLFTFQWLIYCKVNFWKRKGIVAQKRNKLVQKKKLKARVAHPRLQGRGPLSQWHGTSQWGLCIKPEPFQAKTLQNKVNKTQSGSVNISIKWVNLWLQWSSKKERKHELPGSRREKGTSLQTLSVLKDYCKQLF